jgi:hypothetical protein
MEYDRWTHDNEHTAISHSRRLQFWRMQLQLTTIRHRYPDPKSTDRLVAQFHVTYDCKRTGT